MPALDASHNLLDISLSTLIEASPLLGGKLEDRTSVRERQNLDLIRAIMRKTGKEIPDAEQARRFHFGAMDFLVQRRQGKILFTPIELNGTGMAGVSNNPAFVLEALMEEMQKAAERLPVRKAPLFLAPFSGAQAWVTSGTSQLLHERILFAQALKQGYQAAYGKAKIISLPALTRMQKFQDEIPTVALGFVKDFIPYIEMIDGRPTLFGREIHGSLHDQFCDIFYHLFQDKWRPSELCFINHVFPITTNKHETLQLFNQFSSIQKMDLFSNAIFTQTCPDRTALVEAVLKARQQGKSVVIKPHASGLGRGIDFFVKPESDALILEKIDASIEACQRYYGVSEYVFPYAVCEFIDSPVIDSPQHDFHGHKYELRFFIFRQERMIYAIPSIVKISSMKYDPDKMERLMLMNNVAITKKLTNKTGVDYILPLANEKTLQILGLEQAHLFECCQFLTDYLEYALNTLELLPPWRTGSSISMTAT